MLSEDKILKDKKSLLKARDIVESTESKEQAKYKLNLINEILNSEELKNNDNLSVLLKIPCNTDTQEQYRIALSVLNKKELLK